MRIKARYADTKIECCAINFNVHSLNEVNLGDDSCSVHELEVFIPKLGYWKNMAKAFKDRDLIPDNYETEFREPHNSEERDRGWY